MMTGNRALRQAAPSLLVVALLAAAGTSSAAPVKKDLKAMIEEMNRRLTEQDKRITELEAKLKEKSFTEAQKQELTEIVADIKADAAQRGVLPQWMDNLKFYGDLRLRHEYQDRWTAGAYKDRNRERFRLRFGFKKTWLDEQLLVDFRLASGLGATTSTNQTYTGAFGGKALWIDRAYARYTPKEGALKDLSITGGKMPIPFVHTDMTWDSDVNPEGAWAHYKKPIGPVEAFAGVGHFVLQENFLDGGVGGTLRDVDLMVYQGGVNMELVKGVKWTGALAWYEYDNAQAAPGVGFLGANPVNAAGQPLAMNFEVLNLTNFVAFKVLGLPTKVYFDWSTNSGNADRRAGWNEDDAFALGIEVGKNKAKGDWSASYKYAYIEPNALPGGLPDANFGGVNRKGHVWKAKYNLTDALIVGGTIFVTNPVVGRGTGDHFVAQADLIWKF